MISLQELSLAKRKLEKYAKEKKEEGKMAAILNALADYSVTKDILIDSDITTILREIKKNYAESDPGKEAKNVLLKWKKLVEAEESAESKTTTSSSATSEGINDSEDRPSKKMKVDNDAAPSSHLETTSLDVIEGGEWDQKTFEMLSETRKKVLYFITLSLYCHHFTFANPYITTTVSS